MIRLRKLQNSDLPLRVKWMNRPEVYKTMHFVPPISIETTLAWFEKNKSTKNRIDVVFEDENNGQIVAMGGLTSIDYSVRKAEFYVFVNPDAQRLGYGTKATYLLCKYGFEILQLHKIYLFTNESNLGARRTYEKIGFVLEGQMREECIDGEVYEDRLYYGLLASELDKDRIPMQLYGGCLVVQEFKVDGHPISIIRDDIFPQIGGGAKARKAVYYEAYIKGKGYNAVVTCGGIQSNHNRAIALMCARNGWKCHLCIQGNKERFLSEKVNSLLCRQSGTECELIQPEDTAIAMDRAMKCLTAEGYKPYYCHGGGHDLPGGVAFVDAVKFLAQKTEKPDYIFHASGTGSTQAGIVVGLDRVGWSDVKVVGISVARQYERGRQVIVDFSNKLAEYYGMNERYEDRIIFNTDYLCGGYEQYTLEMETYLNCVMRQTGLMFDTTYSGKAFYGMMDYIKKNNLENRKILFWHTGGLMNLMK